MDLILILIGIGLIVWGERQKDDDGQRTGLGTGLFVAGVTITVIGAIVFAIGLMSGFVSATA
ncbi:MAG: hypothetical protein ABEL51_15710 [Salinibacter sp.]